MFTITSQEDAGVEYGPEDILKQRFSDRFWGLGEKTPNRRAVQPGDKVVFYTGLPHKSFAGSATLRSASFTLSPAEQEQLAHGTQLFNSNYGVWLQDPVIWEHSRRVEDLLPSLDFIKNKNFLVRTLPGWCTTTRRAGLSNHLPRHRSRSEISCHRTSDDTRGRR